MIEIWIIIGALLILGYIFSKHYVDKKYGTSLNSMMFRPKNLFRHAPSEEQFEVTVDEMIPPPEKVELKDRTRAELVISRAQNALDKGNLHEGMRLLVQAISMDPSATEAYNKLGIMYLRDNKYGKAEQIFRKLTLSKLDEPSYYGNLGLALYGQKKLEDAKQQYRKAIELDASRAGRFFSLAQIMLELEEFEESINHFKKALAMDPKNISYLLTLAHLYSDKGLKADALQLVSEILLIEPTNSEALSIRRNLEKESTNK